MIFEDPSQKRWRLILQISFGISAIIFAFFSLFMFSGYIIEVEPPDTGQLDKLFVKNEDYGALSYEDVGNKQKNGEIVADDISSQAANQKKRIQKLKRLPPMMNRTFTYSAFISQEDIADVKDILLHSDRLDAVFMDTLSFMGSGCEMTEKIDWNLFETLKSKNVVIYPRFKPIQNGEDGFFRMIRDKHQSSCLIDSLKEKIVNRGFKGISIDIGNVEVGDKITYTEWLISLVDSFHKDDLYVIVNVPLRNPGYDYGNIGLLADKVSIKAFDEYHLPQTPGPISGKFWFEDGLYDLSGKIPPEKAIVALGFHSYDWNLSSPTKPEARSFDVTMRIADDKKSKIRFDENSGNYNFRYADNDGNTHEVWFADAVTAWNEYLHIKEKRLSGISIWRMGIEDETLWKFIPRHEIHTQKTQMLDDARTAETSENGYFLSGFLDPISYGNGFGRATIETIGYENPDKTDKIKTVSLVGSEEDALIDDYRPFCIDELPGAVFRGAVSELDRFKELSESLTETERKADAVTAGTSFGFQGFDPGSLNALPEPEDADYIGTGNIMKILAVGNGGRRKIIHDGKVILNSEYISLPKSTKISRAGSGKPKTIALAFYDGPDRESSEKILDMLEKNRIKATFFLADDNIGRFPSTALRESNEDHLLGIRMPPVYDMEPGSKKDIEELSESFEKNFRYISGHRPTLISAPYGLGNIGKSSSGELNGLHLYGKLGYLLAGADVDLRNYDDADAENTSDNVLRGLKKDGSNIITMTDGRGGNRSVKILEKLIPKAKAEGYEFITMDAILGVDKESVMPAISFGEHFLIFGKPIILDQIGDFIWKFIAAVFLISTLFSILRMIFIGIYVYRSKDLQKKHYSNEFTPPATVLVPAYNEEKVIERTIIGLLDSDYPKFEILVIDDGSKDKTAECVKRLTEKYENVRLISKVNEGKSLALNLGFKEAKYDYIVTIDADTIVFPKTIKYLMQPFADPQVDAVCGNILVGNVKNILTSFQEVEYVIGQNFDKRAFDALNCISVVPGATGAWRKQRVLDVGGYSDDTLVEDADLTLSILEKGGRITYSPLAKSVTEAPEKVYPLFKQRFRWSFGTFQCFWKHRKTFGKGPLGLIALPNMLLFQVILPLFSPIGDLVLLFSVFTGDLKLMFISYLLFLLIDVILSGTSYMLDKRSTAHVWVILIQRFFYRQFMYVVLFKSIIAALKGKHHGWNKLERKGTVEVADNQ